MKYYLITTQTERARRWVKLAATAEQLFTFSMVVPNSRLGDSEGAVVEALNSFTVKPNSMENFQVCLCLFARCVTAQRERRMIEPL